MNHAHQDQFFLRPGIILMSADDADEFKWLSDGWYREEVQHLPEAQRLMAKAIQCMDEAKTVPEATLKLTLAGFFVRREL